ncbi:TniB family NTP-binding protein [Phaeobacter inhibens]|uniref:TniB family NTP-binding protein n=1 Tax=Phaeobacter inhibens TaxID=221822 RepID=UPI0021A5F9CF|nr:TniB family NTP-binding protein [Phaeobacter inhibens]UWR49781.1 TniB family NTP-binding protein [Phaeobacter inhibens]
MNTHPKHKAPADIAGVIEALSDIHVETQREEDLRAAFDRLFVWDETAVKPRYFTKGLETRGLAVVGDPGSGKTELISHFLENHERFHLGSDLEEAGCLHVTVPSPATLKSVGLEILKALGYSKMSERRERWAIWEMVKHRLSLLGVRVLWIDEAHDLYASGSAREQEDLLKTLKSLMQGEHAVVVVLSGTKPVAELLKTDGQVGRRFGKIHLPPVTVASDGEAVEGLLHAFCDRAGLDAQVDSDLIHCLIAAAQSQFGLVIEISIGAIEMALYDRSAKLSRQSFVDYWGMQEGCAIEDNVFWSNRFGEFQEVTTTAASNATKRRGRK